VCASGSTDTPCVDGLVPTQEMLILTLLGQCDWAPTNQTLGGGGWGRMAMRILRSRGEKIFAANKHLHEAFFFHLYSRRRINFCREFVSVTKYKTLRQIQIDYIKSI
jgi:hypothetical protein